MRFYKQSTFIHYYIDYDSTNTLGLQDYLQMPESLKVFKSLRPDKSGVLNFILMIKIFILTKNIKSPLFYFRFKDLTK